MCSAARRCEDRQRQYHVWNEWGARSARSEVSPEYLGSSRCPPRFPSPFLRPGRCLTATCLFLGRVSTKKVDEQVLNFPDESISWFIGRGDLSAVPGSAKLRPA